MLLSHQCFCFPAPPPREQPPRRLLTGHCGTGTPRRPLPCSAHSAGPRKERGAVSPPPKKPVLGVSSSSVPARPHLRQRGRRRAARTRRGGSSQGPGAGPAAHWALRPHQVNLLCGNAPKPTQSSLTLHGKYWSSRRPIPRHPRMFLPHTNSSPLPAKKETRGPG